MQIKLFLIFYISTWNNKLLTLKNIKEMKRTIGLFMFCTLFLLTIQMLTGTVMGMRHDDDTLAVKYTKEMLQGKLWEFEIPEGVEVDGYAYIEFKHDSLYQTFTVDGKTTVFPCIYYLSDSYQTDYKEESEDFNQAGKYIQVKYFYTNSEGIGETESQSFWIRKLTNDTLELIEWRSRNTIERYHAKPIKKQ